MIFKTSGEEVAVQTITHSTAIDFFTTSITWIEDNGKREVDATKKKT
jgi:hypothetical protein